MICMEMSNKKVCFSYVHSEFPQTGVHGLQALLLIPSRINDQIPFPIPDHVGVEGFQGTLEKRNFNFVKICQNFFNHLLHSEDLAG